MNEFLREMGFVFCSETADWRRDDGVVLTPIGASYKMWWQDRAGCKIIASKKRIREKAMSDMMSQIKGVLDV